MAGNYIVNIPRLKGRENYGDWAFAAENFLVLEGLSKCISEVVPNDDAKAKAKLILTIDTSLYIHIKEAKTTMDLWDKLKALFDDKGFARKINLLRNLISLRLENCESMANYVNQVVETGQKLRGTGFDINDEWIGSLLLAGLPDKYQPMIMAIEHSGIAITTDSIKTKLLDMEIDVSSGSAFASKQFSRDNRNKNMKSDANFNKQIKCYKCKQIGHFKSKCPNRDNKDTGKQKTSNAFSVVFLNGSFSKLDWYIDSGASVHLSANKQWFNNIKSSANLQEIMVANKTSVPVVCSGDTNLTTVVGHDRYDITVKNVLCVPDLATNLLSVSQLIMNGNTVKFMENCCNIFNKQNELVGTADLKNGVYKLNTLKAECFLSAKAVSTGEVWHRRFGHLNSAYLNKMKNGIVEGLNYPGVLDIGQKNCQVCCEGKQARLPFKNKGHRATDILEIIHTDVCGPMENMSLGGSKYFVIFEDDFSRMVFVYFIKTKDQVFDCFKNFKNMVENQKGRKIKILRSDNGGEFCNKMFKNFLKSNGIIHQKTNPYTPEQNGMSERINRTVIEKSKCMLFDANLEKKFWAEAVHTAVYLRNRSLASGLEKTPYELWTGRVPDVKNLRIFGSSVMVHVPKEKRLKWDRKAIKCILVGYDDEVKGYRVYDTQKNTIFTSRDVTIMENIEEEVNIMVDSTAETNVDNDEKILVPVGDPIPHELIEDDILSNSSGEIWENATSNESDSSPDEEVPVVLRRSKRVQNQRDLKKGFSCMYPEDSTLDTDPETVKAALSRPDGDQWKKAMEEELHSFEENQAWELVDIPEKQTIVQCKWVFKQKIDCEGNVRYRARLVAKGFTQKPGVDFDETFSPVVRHSSLRLLIALSVKLELDIMHLDVTTAFLNGILEENVFMTLPEGFDNHDKNKVLKLNKAIYGLKQSARAWYMKVDVVLTNLGYKKSDNEPC